LARGQTSFLADALFLFPASKSTTDHKHLQDG
jgi:hypothetical protein